jgi:hypothetical protein
MVTSSLSAVAPCSLFLLVSSPSVLPVVTSSPTTPMSVEQPAAGPSAWRSGATGAKLRGRVGSIDPDDFRPNQ